jgi:hypothetical protein
MKTALATLMKKGMKGKKRKEAARKVRRLRFITGHVPRPPPQPKHAMPPPLPRELNLLGGQPMVARGGRPSNRPIPDLGTENREAWLRAVLQFADRYRTTVPMDLDVPFDPNALGLKEIGNLASWTVSSCKPGCGVEALRDDDTGMFWQ